MSDVKREVTSREMRAIEVIAGLNNRLNKDEKHLETRLKLIPDMWRRYRIAKSAIDKVIDGIYENVPMSVLLHMRKLQDNSELVFRPKSPLNSRTDVHVVLATDLKYLINDAMRQNCAMCLKTDREIKHCELRKVLMNVAPFQERSHTALCEYVHEAIKHDLGEYV